MHIKKRGFPVEKIKQILVTTGAVLLLSLSSFVVDASEKVLQQNQRTMSNETDYADTKVLMSELNTEKQFKLWYVIQSESKTDKENAEGVLKTLNFISNTLGNKIPETFENYLKKISIEIKNPQFGEETIEAINTELSEVLEESSFKQIDFLKLKKNDFYALVFEISIDKNTLDFKINTQDYKRKIME